MNIKNFDLNLLRVFHAIYQTRNISVAATSIGLSQPATSNALKRLRDQCEDPLFIRSGSKMEPTALAILMSQPVQTALNILETCFSGSVGFNPLKSQQRFKILISDVGEMVVFTRLMAVLPTLAPNVSVEALQMPHSEYASMLRNGEADLAIGNIDFLQSGFYQQNLFKDRYLCIARLDHPTIRGGISLKQYTTLEHVLSKAGNTEKLLDELLTAQQKHRNIKMIVTNYHVAAMVVCASDLIATVPEISIPMINNVQKIPLPIKIPAAQIRQFWHKRAHKDPASKWFRGVIAGLSFNKAFENSK